MIAELRSYPVLRKTSRRIILKELRPCVYHGEDIVSRIGFALSAIHKVFFWLTNTFAETFQSTLGLCVCSAISNGFFINLKGFVKIVDPFEQ